MAAKAKRLRVYTRRLEGREYPEVRISGRYLREIGIEIGDTVQVTMPRDSNGQRIIVRKVGR